MIFWYMVNATKYELTYYSDFINLAVELSLKKKGLPNFF